METATDKINGYEYVDLGLPSGTLWASHDIGANNVGEFGKLFMWGEIEPRDEDKEWSDEDHKYVSNSNFIKYNGSDNKVVLDPADDAATTLWGRDWQIPSSTDWKELKMYCDLEIVDDSIVFVGPNGNELHFSKYLYESYEDGEFSCSWWSSEVDSSDDEYESIYFYVDKDKDCEPECDVFACHRACLCTIRPVSKIRADLNFVLPEDDETEDDYSDDSTEDISQTNSDTNSESYDEFYKSIVDKLNNHYQSENVSNSSSVKYEKTSSRKTTYTKDGYEKDKTSNLSYVLFAIAILVLMLAFI